MVSTLAENWNKTKREEMIYLLNMV